MRIPGPRFYPRLITLWIALSVGGILTGVLLWRRLNASLEATVVNAQTRHQFDVVFSLLQDAETGQRGYLLTDDVSYLAPYRRAEAEFPGQFELLARMSMSDERLRTDMLELRALAELKLNELRQTIAARRESAAAALRIVRSNEGRNTMDQIRAVMQRLDKYPDDLFFVHGEATRRGIQRTLLTTIVASLLGLGAGLFAFRLSRVASKQEQRARALVEQAGRASRADREKSAFLANMSHEIRTPMNAILGFSDLLAAELPAAGKPHNYARAIRDSARSLLQLINDILDLSKIEAGMVELNAEPTDLSEIAGFLQTVFAQQSARKAIELKFNLSPVLPRNLLLDRSRLRQMLVNLVGNAIKYTERGSVEVRVGWEPDAVDHGHGALMVEVIDTGIGIPADRQDAIFQPFVQVDARRAMERQGTGLGLAIVRRLAQRMGGTISLESAVGRGSTFRLRFSHIPIATARPAKPDAEEEEVNFNELAPARLLVVDDNAANRELLAGYFDGTHHQVFFASNGIEAVEGVHHQHPDVVLMDIRMPKMDGRAALLEIRKTRGPEALPVIAITASSMWDDEYLLRSQFAGYLLKPFARQALFRELARVLPTRFRPSSTAPFPPAIHQNPETAPAATPVISIANVVIALRELEENVWGAVRDSGAINETKVFARRLEMLGRAGNCALLSDYAAALAEDANAYAVARLEGRLNGFPALIRSIEQSSLPAVSR